MRKNNTSKFTSYLIVIISMILMVYSFVKQIEITNKEKTIPQQVQEQVKVAIEETTNKASEFPDYSSLKGLNKLILRENFVSWTPRAQKDPSKIVETIIIDKGSLAKAYIYIKASIDDSALTQWESIYMTMNYRGGHLFRPQSLQVPKGNKTELLYALNDIPYLITIPYNERSAPSRTNWFSLLNDNNKILVTAFISSLRPTKIEELTIYYSCEINSDCLLTKAQ